MTPAQRESFCKAYSEFRSLDSFLAYEEFWSICTLVSTARIHVQHRQPIQSLMKQLESISQGAADALWPELS